MSWCSFISESLSGIEQLFINYFFLTNFGTFLQRSILLAPYLARTLGAPTTGEIGCAWPCCGEGEPDTWFLIEKGFNKPYFYGVKLP